MNAFCKGEGRGNPKGDPAEGGERGDDHLRAEPSYFFKEEVLYYEKKEEP